MVAKVVAIEFSLMYAVAVVIERCFAIVVVISVGFPLCFVCLFLLSHNVLVPILAKLQSTICKDCSTIFFSVLMEYMFCVKFRT